MVPYGRDICKGKLVGSIVGPYHVAYIYEYTKKNVDNLVRLTGLSSGDSSPAWWTHHGTESHRGTAREAS